MSAERLIRNLSWIPIAGSALGNVVSGRLADWVVLGCKRDVWWVVYFSAGCTFVGGGACTRAGRAHTSVCAHVHAEEALHGSDPLSHMPTMIAEDAEYHSTGIELTTVTATDESGLIAEDNHHQNGSISTNGVQLYATDSTTEHKTGNNIIKERDVHTPQAACIRMLICAVGNAIAMPFVCMALVLDYPYCFWVQIFSGWVAESYMSQSLAVVGDCELLLMPAALRLPAVALFLLLVNNIASGIQFLVPCFAARVGYSGTVVVHFTAAAVWHGPNSSAHNVHPEAEG